MKLIKTLLCVAAIGAVTFATSNAYAVMGQVKISGKAYYQDYNKSGFPVTLKHSIGEKEIMQLLAIGTGDSSITNYPTKLLYDPDAFNWAWWYSDDGYYDGYSRDGCFYYTNSYVGLQQLQNYDYYYEYYSWIELDSFVGYDWWFYRLGMADQYTTEYNYIAKSSDTKDTFTGNAVLYIHSNEYDFDLPSYNYYANNYYGYTQTHALVIRGLITFTASDDGTTVKESFKLTGSGDGLWYDSTDGYTALVFAGKAQYSGKGVSP